MVKIWLSLLLVYVLVFTAAPALAGTLPDKQAQTEAQIKAKIARLGTGEGARARVRLKNGTKLKGSIQQAGDTGFVLKDKETGAPVQLLYRDVARVGDDQGRSPGKKIAIGMGIGFGALLTLAAIGFATAD